MQEGSEIDHQFEQTKMLINSSFQSAHSFDKAILTLASGAFGLSFVFLKDVVPILDKSTLILLEIAWLLFALSIVTILVSFLTSQKACNFLLKRIYKPDEKKNNWSTATQTLNIISITCLISAIFFMVFFFYTNLLNNQGEKMEKNPKKLEEGYVPPPLHKNQIPPSPQKGYVPPPLPQQPKEPPKNPPTTPQPESPKPEK